MLSKKIGFLLLAALFIGSCLVTFAFSWKATYEVTLYYGDESSEMRTTAKTVADFLTEAGIVVGDQDLIWPEQEAKINDGITILVKKAVPVTVKLGKQPDQFIWTTSSSVEGALRELGYIPNDMDIVTPNLNQPIEADQRIEVIEVSYGIVEKPQELKYRTVRKADDSLVAGTEKVVHAGELGEELLLYRGTYYNGELVDLDYMRTELVEEPTEEIVHYGTIEPVSIGGYSFVPKKVLKNVKLTAYSVQENISGKGPDHPQYGITRSGTKVKDNHTIAVDPDLIPLGWWVYIEGYGLYKAEDTGGAIKGKKIDIYIDDLDAVKKFGVKRNKTVYVIGPNKPSSN